MEGVGDAEPPLSLAASRLSCPSRRDEPELAPMLRLKLTLETSTSDYGPTESGKTVWKSSSLGLSWHLKRSTPKRRTPLFLEALREAVKLHPWRVIGIQGRAEATP